MKKIFRIINSVLFFCFMSEVGLAESLDEQLDYEVITAKDYDWWTDARFGIFIHWGPSSLLELGKGSWHRQDRNLKKGANKRRYEVPEIIASGEYLKYKERPSRGSRVPTEIYDNLYHVFDPTEFNADDWARTFSEAGAGYVVFTTKHHDGFAMFDSAYTDYDIMSTPFGRDISKELADACHKYGLKVIWYYSVADWFHPVYSEANPDAYIGFMHNQVEELSTNYGDIAGFWWDRDRINIETEPLFERIRRHNPGAISNDRIKGGSAKYNVPGVAFATPENRVGEFLVDQPWESCVTIYPHDFWFWNGDRGCRTIEFTLPTLINCAVGDGNLLLDFGPTQLGEIPEDVRKNFKAIGSWLKQYGETIYGTRGGPYKPGVWGGSTRRENEIYLHVMQKWPGGKFALPPLPFEILDAKALTGGSVEVLQSEEVIMLSMNPEDIDPLDTIIRLRFREDTMLIDPIETMPQISLTFDSVVTASSVMNDLHLPESVVGHSWDRQGMFTAAAGEIGGSEGVAASVPVPEAMKPVAQFELDSRRRFWEAAPNDESPWLQLKFRQEIEFDRIKIRESAGTVRQFVIEYKVDGVWKSLYEGGQLELFSLQLEEPVTAREIRIRFTEFVDAPGIHTVDVYSPEGMELYGAVD